ncbi:MAG: serine/threonine protein kinase [Planctomycetes bacterium]|nr:serine/threonine protein kinase [Planctomycetota bacterium]
MTNSSINRDAECSPDREAHTEALARTLPGAEFSAAGMNGSAQQRPDHAEALPPPPLLPEVDLPTRMKRGGREPTPLPGPLRYEVGQRLGAGATGQVYAVLDRDLQRVIAIKVLAPEPSGADGKEAASFLNEARLTASLQHPNVTPIHEIDVDQQGRLYFSMKRVAGRSLGQEIADSTLAARSARLASPNAIVDIFIAIANALAFAHHAGIVHQDIKPDNIMLGAFGETLLVDWGSAVRLDSGEMRLYGTPLYMSPEQARREGSDQRSDIY